MEQNNSYNLYLDDFRSPRDSFSGGPKLRPGNPVYLKNEWVVVKSHDEFVKAVVELGAPIMVSFDHDLSDEHYVNPLDNPKTTLYKEKTGYDSALSLITYLQARNLPMPTYFVHSYNPTGAAVIQNLLDDYVRYAEKGMAADFVEQKNTERKSIWGNGK